MIQKGRDWNLSKDGALVERLRAAKIGKPRSQETKEKLRQATLRNAEFFASIHRGSKRSEETRQKQREAWIRRKARSLDGKGRVFPA
jgi:hypothetical protein